MGRKKDEYDDIYNQEDSGFEFNYKNNRIGKSREIFGDDISNLDSSKHNDDNDY